jgi:hypothetical protein
VFVYSLKYDNTLFCISNTGNFLKHFIECRLQPCHEMNEIKFINTDNKLLFLNLIRLIDFQ